MWYLWVMVEPMGPVADAPGGTAGMSDGYWLKDHLIDSAAHMRVVTMAQCACWYLGSARGIDPREVKERPYSSADKACLRRGF